MAFVLGLPAGKDYSASRSVTTPVVPCVSEHHRQPDRIRLIRTWRVTSKTRRFHQMNSLVTSYGIGSSELPGAIDEQFCGAGRPAKRCLIQAIEFGSQSVRLQTWLSSSYCS